MNPWPLVIALIIVLIIKAFHWIHAVGYGAGCADRKMKAEAEKRKGYSLVMQVNHIDVAEFPISADEPVEFNFRIEGIEEAKAEEPSDD